MSTDNTSDGAHVTKIDQDSGLGLHQSLKIGKPYTFPAHVQERTAQTSSDSSMPYVKASNRND